MTAAYLRIIRSVFHPPKAITIGAENSAFNTMVAPWCLRSGKWKSLSPALRADVRNTLLT